MASADASVVTVLVGNAATSDVSAAGGVPACGVCSRSSRRRCGSGSPPGMAIAYFMGKPGSPVRFPGLASGHCAHDHERLRAGGYGLRERRVWFFVG